MDARNQAIRRIDRWSAERIELAALTARAFNLRTAKTYLRLSGVGPALIDSFAARYPAGLRTASTARGGDRRSPAA